MTTTTTTATAHASATWSMPRILLQLEGLALFAGVGVLYAYQGYSWWMFALFLLAPDLAAIGYAAGPRIGAAMYNALHTLVLPLALVVISILVHSDLGLQIALIWFAHIGMDRAVGYGLKYTAAFKETHLGRV